VPNSARIKRRPYRSFLSYIDLTREYYAAHGYAKPYGWANYEYLSFSKLQKPLAECRVALLTTADLEKPPGENFQERLLARKVYAQPVNDAPEHFYTQDLHWDYESTHTDDNDSFLPLNRLAECAANGKIGSASPRFYGVPADYSQSKTSKKAAPRVLEFCKADGVDALILPAL
jgi:hypothetical protein